MNNFSDSVKEISMERIMYKRPFPAFKVVFKSDGEATYEGKYFVDKIGKYVGEIDDTDFKMLSSLMERLGFIDLRDKYMIDGRDQPSVVTTIVHEGGTKTVGDYGEAGPVEIWAIEKVIDTLVEDIYWEKEE